MVDRIVLDVELANAKPIREPIAAYERGESRVESGARLAGDRQQLAVTPQILGTPLDLGVRERDGGVVVDRLERPQAPIAHVVRFGRERRLTEMTLQSDESAHTASATLRSVRPEICWGTTCTGAGT